MKKLIILCLLLATAFTVKAQKLSFEETVTYINEIFTENLIGYSLGNSGGRYINGIAADKSGKVIFYDREGDAMADKHDKVVTSINLFDISFWLAPNNSPDLFIKDSNDREIGQFSGLSNSTRLRLKKAFDHLRSTCTKKADPFGE